MVLPAIVGFNDLIGDHKAGAGDRAAGAAHHPRLVQIFRFPQKPQGITRGDPVGIVILGVAVAGDNRIAGIKNFVHFPNIVRIEQVIGIKDGKISLSMKALEEVVRDEPEEKVVIPKSESIGTSLGDLFKNIKL